MHRSLSLLALFAAAVFGQGSQLPQTTTADQPALPGCAGCFIIANVAQVIFADYTTTQTATAIASQGLGRNGSVVSTTLIQQLPPFSFNSAGLLSGQAVTGAYIPLTGTLVTIGGATLTSPTAYNVFTAYTEFQLTQVGAVCSTAALAPVIVSPAVQFLLGADVGASEVLENESKFIDSQPRITCPGSGVIISTTIPVSVVTTTTTSSTTSIFRPTPIAQTQTAAATSTSAPSAAASSAAASSAAASSAAASSAAASSAAASSSTSDASIEISMGPSGTEAIITSTPIVTLPLGAASGFRFQSSSLSSTLFLALFALPGIGAWLL